MIFQVYSIIIQHLYTLQVITTTSLVTIHHHAVDLLTCFAYSTTPFPLITTNLICVSMSLFLFILFVSLFYFIIFCIWVKPYGICLSPSDLLPLVYNNIFRVTLVITNGRISFFFMTNIPLCIYATSSLPIHPLIGT